MDDGRAELLSFMNFNPAPTHLVVSAGKQSEFARISLVCELAMARNDARRSKFTSKDRYEFHEL